MGTPWTEAQWSRPAGPYPTGRGTRDGGQIGGFFEDPGVLGAAALGGVDDEGALRQRDAGEAAGHDDDLLAVEDEGPQVDVAALEMVRRHRSGAGELDDGLGDVVARVGADFARRIRRARAAEAWWPMSMP